MDKVYLTKRRWCPRCDLQGDDMGQRRIIKVLESGYTNHPVLDRRKDPRDDRICCVMM